RTVQRPVGVGDDPSLWSVVCRRDDLSARTDPCTSRGNGAAAPADTQSARDTTSRTEGEAGLEYQVRNAPRYCTPRKANGQTRRNGGRRRAVSWRLPSLEHHRLA